MKWNSWKLSFPPPNASLKPVVTWWDLAWRSSFWGLGQTLINSSHNVTCTYHHHAAKEWTHRNSGSRRPATSWILRCDSLRLIWWASKGRHSRCFHHSISKCRSQRLSTLPTPSIQTVARSRSHDPRPNYFSSSNRGVCHVLQSSWDSGRRLLECAL